MIRHLLKVVWRRKGSNALVMAEIFLSFLVIFAVVAIAITLSAGWRRPLGFEWKDVWLLDLEAGAGVLPSQSGDDPFRQTLDRLLTEAKSFPQVVDAAASATPPYLGMTSSGRWNVQGKTIDLTRDEVTDAFANVMRLKLVDGRWFSAADDAAAFRPVVIDTDLAREFFGDKNPIGEKIDEDGGVEYRVVGTIVPYRKDGEVSPRGVNMLFYRKSLQKPGGSMPRNILLRVRPGTSADFEVELTRRLHAVAPDATIRVRRMERLRDFTIRSRIQPLMVVAVLALFLVSMVALGLSGVLWQTVTRRTRELGLRRALGASAGAVRSQVLGEVAILATLAVSVGVVMVLQLPLLGVFRFIAPPVFALGLGTALAVVYAITLLCGAYPSWLASRVQPAEALRYE